MARPKPDRDMGHEVNQLGGFRPGQRLVARPLASTRVEIIARGPQAFEALEALTPGLSSRLGLPRAAQSEIVRSNKPRPWYKRPFLSFGRDR